MTQLRLVKPDAPIDRIKEEYVAYSTIMVLVGRANLRLMPRLKPLVRKAQSRLAFLQEHGRDIAA